MFPPEQNNISTDTSFIYSAAAANDNNNKNEQKSRGYWRTKVIMKVKSSIKQRVSTRLFGLYPCSSQRPHDMNNSIPSILLLLFIFATASSLTCLLWWCLIWRIQNIERFYVGWLPGIADSIRRIRKSPPILLKPHARSSLRLLPSGNNKET